MTRSSPFSNSGETAELNDIILFASRHGIPITGVTKQGDSFLARHADYVLLLPNEPEACPIGCAPTTSTTLKWRSEMLSPFPAQGKGLRRGGFPPFPPRRAAWQEAA